MIILPEEYQNLELSKHEKLLVTLAKNKISSEGSYFLLKINPVGVNPVNVLITTTGLTFLETIPMDNIDLLKNMLPILGEARKKSFEKIFNKIRIHKPFINREQQNSLVFPFTYKYYFPLIEKQELVAHIVNIQPHQELLENSIFSDTKKQLSEDPEGFVQSMLLNCPYPYKKDYRFDIESISSLMHILAPEYTIPRTAQYTKYEGKLVLRDETVPYAIYNIKPGELFVEALCLDNEQINIINNLKRGHQLILACAGSGKSVLLVSRCFKIASQHPDKEFLITCKNRNLSDSYNWRINVAGFRNRNVKCCTFDKLCQDLLAEVGIDIVMSDFQGTFEKAQEALIKGKIKKRFYGIFIDEIQVFKSEHYEFCYNLLESHSTDNYFFTISGDKSQDIAANIKHGNAPWQGNPELPKYTGRSLRIEKNYRNTIEINRYVDLFTQNAKRYAKKYGISLEENEDLFLRGKAFRNGPEPELVLTDRLNEAEEVVKKVLYLNEEKNIPLSEIAILFFYRQYQSEHYYILKWLKDKLNEYYLEYSELISSTDGSYGVLYGDRQGLSLCTIESSLGLDFRAVIICGLNPMGAHFKTKQAKVLEAKGLNEEQSLDFAKNVNTLYTACTRARDYLYIILNENEKKSIYSKLLIEAIDERGMK